MHKESTDKDEGLSHIYSENTYGYYFDFYTADSKDKDRNGTITLNAYDDDMFFEVENSGTERELSLQIFVDYKQVPIILDDVEYDTFIIQADENFSEAYQFKLATPVDTSINHTLLAILTAGSNIYTSLADFKMSNHYSIALDHVLVFAPNNSLYQANTSVEETQVVTEYQSSGLFLNSDINGRGRKLTREITVNAGEEFQLQYQTGGYEDCEEVAIIITMGLEQVQINNQDFILCKVENGELVSGIATLKAPEEAGLYEIMGWVVKNPFDADKSEYLPLDAMHRFTLNVE
ncbi:hypothetical protein [Desulfofarcimen acetoxidans]|nr:hypothetical protein [Desulfofarcimen acetoxidans]